MRRSAIIDALRSCMRGVVLDAQGDREPFGYDYGAHCRAMPLVVVRPVSEQDVVHTLQVARAYGVSVSVRGGGHACGGQPLCRDGIVIVNATDDEDIIVGDDSRVEVSARTTWAALERVLNAHGRSTPVLTNNLQSTVGGTLAVGGFGPRSITHGAQIDHVERLRLIQPDGTAIWCSPADEPELFRFTLAGLGQIGVIERVVMRTTPHRPLLRLQTNEYRSRAEAIDAIAWTADWTEESPDHFFVHVEGGAGHCTSNFATAFEQRDDAIFTPVPTPLRAMQGATVRMARRPPVMSEARDLRYRSFWSDYCFDLDGLRAFGRFVDAAYADGRLPANPSNDFLYCLRRPAAEAPCPFDIRSIGGSGRNVYGFGLHYRVERDDEERAAACRSALRMALATCVELGGRPYLYGWNELDEHTRRQLYGHDYDRLLELRRRVDPNNLLNPNALIGAC